MTRSNRLPAAVLAAVAIVFLWSGWAPKDRLTWFLEVLPAIFAAPILIATWKRFPLTSLATVLIGIHASILMVGGRYTYAEVPLFNWIRDALHATRNDYDRVGHFAQGFVPAIVAREILLRRSPLRPGKWLFFLVLCVCLAISASYELFEWRTAVAAGAKSDAFLGTQGDPWDTQEDMATAGVGALAALVLLSRVHDRQLARLVELRDQ
jgi:putative membrane protein